MDEFDELKKEVMDSSLAGQSNWTDDTKIAYSIGQIKKLKKKIAEFEKLCVQMQLKVNRKVEKLRENWRIDDTLEEITRLERAVKIAFEVPSPTEDDKKDVIKNPFKEE